MKNIKFLIIFILFSILIMQIPIYTEETGLFANPDKTSPPKQSPDSTNVSKDVFNIKNADDYLLGMKDARIAAKASPLSFFSGCCLGPLGIIIPYIVPYNYQFDKLYGRSSDYTIGFMKQYDNSMKVENGEMAVYGFASCIGSYLLFYIFMIVTN